MRRLLRRHADLSVKLIIGLGRRLRETNERVARQSFQPVPSRVARVLSQLIAEEAIPVERVDHPRERRRRAAELTSELRRAVERDLRA